MLVLHFAFCLGVAFIGAAWATGFPYAPSGNLPDSYEAHLAREKQALQYSAIIAACVTSLLTAFWLRSSDALREGRFLRHFAVMFALLVANHFLWVEPIWGFHHDYSLGIFAWLVLLFEEGDGIRPNYIGLAMTFFPYWVLIREVAPWAMGSEDAATEDSNIHGV